VDSGTVGSLIAESCVPPTVKVEPLPSNLKLTAVTGHRIRTAGLATLNNELESDVIVKQQFVVCEDGLFNRFNGLLGYDFMENYDVILRPKESVMYIGEHEIPLMSGILYYRLSYRAQS